MYVCSMYVCVYMVYTCHFFHKSVKHNIHHYWIVHLKTNQNSLRTPITLSGLLLFVCLFVLPSGNNLWFICQGLVPISQPGPQSFWGEVWDVAILFLGSLLSVVSHRKVLRRKSGCPLCPLGSAGAASAASCSAPAAGSIWCLDSCSIAPGTTPGGETQWSSIEHRQGHICVPGSQWVWLPYCTA